MFSVSKNKREIWMEKNTEREREQLASCIHYMQYKKAERKKEETRKEINWRKQERWQANLRENDPSSLQ